MTSTQLNNFNPDLFYGNVFNDNTDLMVEPPVSLAPVFYQAVMKS